MASYLRPRRGSFANAKSQLTASNPLKSGEVFFECENIGKAQGKIKLGDATTTYSSLPYFLSMQDSSIGFTDVTGSNSTAESTILGNIKPSATHSSVITNIKQLLWNHSSKISALDAKKVNTNTMINNHSLDRNISLTASDVGAVPTSRTVNNKALSSDITLSASDVGALSNSISIMGGTSGDSYTKIATIVINNIKILVITAYSCSMSPGGIIMGGSEVLIPVYRPVIDANCGGLIYDSATETMKYIDIIIHTNGQVNYSSANQSVSRGYGQIICCYE